VKGKWIYFSSGQLILVLPVTKVGVRYFGILHDLVGKRSETLTVGESDTILDLVKLISSKHGKKFEEFVFDSKGKIRPGLAFAINGSSVERSSLGKTECKDVKEFVILPPISGGR